MPLVLHRSQRAGAPPVDSRWKLSEGPRWREGCYCCTRPLREEERAIEAMERGQLGCGTIGEVVDTTLVGLSRVRIVSLDVGKALDEEALTLGMLGCGRIGALEFVQVLIEIVVFELVPAGRLPCRGGDDDSDGADQEEPMRHPSRYEDTRSCL